MVLFGVHRVFRVSRMLHRTRSGSHSLLEPGGEPRAHFNFVITSIACFMLLCMGGNIGANRFVLLNCTKSENRNGAMFFIRPQSSSCKAVTSAANGLVYIGRATWSCYLVLFDAASLCASSPSSPVIVASFVASGCARTAVISFCTDISSPILWCALLSFWGKHFPRLYIARARIQTMVSLRPFSPSSDAKISVMYSLQHV